MLGRTLRAIAGLVGVAVVGGGATQAIAAERPVGKGVCRRGIVEGEVRAGESLSRPIGGGLQVRMEPLSWGSGWLLQVLPESGPRLIHDYAGLATPPYDSVNPLLFSTDFSFRAQDAVAWNPRRFRFAASAAEFARLMEAYERYGKHVPPAQGAESELAAMVSKASEGKLEILDAHLIPGTANQAQMAAMVASHFSSTAHRVEEPTEGKGMALGKLTWARYRISLDFPQGFRVNPEMKIEEYKCP
ncbi:hypothetical protein [Granulicella sp. dw_53]|uniref:hypothetical protein n=1 Tax=Granulicella sp. dw_53 TaxID=2719792 RepID=UPI001BD61F92|nr:hypothetical protein [Granulicella sp. dw_53]